MALYSDGVKIYRKSLRDSRNEKPEAVQNRVRIRSRQQRVSICVRILFCLNTKVQRLSAACAIRDMAAL